MKILILRVIFNFHKYLRKNLVWLFINSRYIDLTVKIAELVSFQTNFSRLLDNCTVISRWHKWIHWFHLYSLKVLLKLIFSGVFSWNGCSNTMTTKHVGYVILVEFQDSSTKWWLPDEVLDFFFKFLMVLCSIVTAHVYDSL
jgi:hypothetical protein